MRGSQSLCFSNDLQLKILNVAHQKYKFETNFGQCEKEHLLFLYLFNLGFLNLDLGTAAILDQSRVYLNKIPVCQHNTHHLCHPHRTNKSFAFY